MAHVDWYIEGKQFGNCICNYGCPCQFEDLPTQGFCRGFEVMEIAKGHFSDTDLTGLRFVLIYAWPGPIFEGRGELQMILDERADEKQREALQTVLTGGETEEAKTHWWVYHAMSDTVHPTLYAPIEVEIDIEGRRARLDVPGMMTATGRPIRPPHSDDEHRVQIGIPGGIEFELAEVGSASTKADTGIKLDLDDSYGQWAFIRHSPTGVVAA